jgi:DNA-directed RNA polymerase subunit RPC12/RpoP
MTSRLEEHRYRCERCARTWTETYEVRESEDLAGTPWRVYLRRGAATPSPTRAPRCPHCQGLRVHHLPLAPPAAG